MQWTQPDTLVPDIYNSLDWNRYSYVRYNPIRYADPSGHMVDDGCRSEGCSVVNPLQSYIVISSTLFDHPRNWNILPEGYKSVLENAGFSETTYSQSEMAGKPGSREAYLYEDPATVLSLGGGAALRVGIAQVIKTIVGVEAADCSVDGQCAATRYVDDVIQFGERSLRHAYDRHYYDWGLPEHRTPATEELLKTTIVDHINGPNTQQILGFFRGNDAIHFFDPATGRNVITTVEGIFVGGWRLASDQILGLFTNGKW